MAQFSEDLDRQPSLCVYYLAYGGAGQHGGTMPDSRWQYTIWKRLLCIQVACSNLLETLAVQSLQSPESACAACEVILVHVIILFFCVCSRVKAVN